MLSLDGAVDFHVHADPELFGRIGDAVEIARRCAAAGMRAVVFKAHHEGTTTRAYHANQQVGGRFRAFGGLVLNDFVGGINPTAVQAALDMGARVIWGPTMHSRHHEETFGRGTYGIKRQTHAGTIARPGIQVLDGRGELIPELRDVLDRIRDRDAVFATAHLAPPEIEAIVRGYARRMKILINHPFFLPRTVPTEWFAEMAAHGATLEICANIAQPMAFHQGGGMLLSQVTDLVAKAGVDRCIVATDAGQPYSPWPDEELRAFVNCLFDVGMEEAAIHRLIAENPARLLGLD